MESFTAQEEQIIQNFRTARYAHLNQLRWELLLKTGLGIKGRVIFEPGAGIGDQTAWLLDQGASHVYVNEGRAGNLAIILKRFGFHPDVTILGGDIETCLGFSKFRIKCDLTFMWGCYYHINDSSTDFPILRSLTQISPIIVLDYLESPVDGVESYNYDNPSTSISRLAIRPTRHTMIRGLRSSFGFVYFPRDQMDWHDDAAPTCPRRIVIGSRFPINELGLVPPV